MWLIPRERAGLEIDAGRRVAGCTELVAFALRRCGEEVGHELYAGKAFGHAAAFETRSARAGNRCVIDELIRTAQISFRAISLP